MTKQILKPQSSQHISDIIRRKITYRILIVFLMLFVFLISTLLYDLNAYVKTLEESINRNYNELSTFVLDELIVGDREGIDRQLERINASQDQYQVRFIKHKSNPGQALSFNLQFNWQIAYPTLHMGEEDYGYILYEGKLYHSTIFQHYLLLFLAYIFIFILSIAIIYPVYKKIPQDLIIGPVFYLLEVVRSKKMVKQDKYFNSLPQEMKDVFYNIEELIQEVESSTKQVATYRFATRVAHDIRSPLAVLNSVVEQYKQSGQLDVETIMSVCRRISKIANDLVVQDNPRDKHQSVILPYLVLKEVVNEKYYLAKKFSCHLFFSFSEEAKLIFCQASALELSRVFSNLINNAMEAIRASGNVRVNVRHDNNNIIVSIQDDGMGMSDRIKNDIMSGQVVSTKSRGAGIGLRSAIEYIHSLSGELLIDSQEGQGTTLTIRLPTCDMPHWFLDTLVLDDDDSILVVDDEPQIYDSWQEKLKTAAVNMHYISGGEKSVKAFDYIKESRYDLYFLDYQNPHLTKDGVEMIQEYALQEKAILVTSNYDDVLLQKICDSTHIKMLPKGFIQELAVIPVNKTADFYLADDDSLFAKSFCRHVELQDKTIQVFSDIFNMTRCMHLLNKSASCYIDLNIETERDGLQLVNLLLQRGFECIYILSGEDGFSIQNAPIGVKAVYNKAKFNWSAAL